MQVSTILREFIWMITISQVTILSLVTHNRRVSGVDNASANPQGGPGRPQIWGISFSPKRYDTATKFCTVANLGEGKRDS